MSERMDERIPQSALLIAPAFDGSIIPLAEVPACRSCARPYALDDLKEWAGDVYAFLIPDCTCRRVGK